MVKSLKILYACSELTPLAKTGGLADVANALPKALHERGHDVRIIMPCYGFIPDKLKGQRCAACVAHREDGAVFGALRCAVLPEAHIPLYLIEHDGYFWRDHAYGYNAGGYVDNLERFCFFCLAALDAVPRTGWTPDVVHCNDWHTAAIPALLRTRLSNHPVWAGTPTIFTIHSLAYQGRFPGYLLPKSGLGRELFTPGAIEFYGDISLIKAGIGFANKVNTVSVTYAQEIQTPEFGYGLDGFLRTRSKDLSGILNGADYEHWNPGCDPNIEAKYTADDPAGKAQCKAGLQKRLGLPEIPVPIFGAVSRLCWEKGTDLLADALPRILPHDLQVVILGAGAPELQNALSAVANQYPQKCRVMLEHNEPLAHQVYAGSDFFLMPSRIEPCGLSQMYALAYGAVPIVRETGGLADTVHDITPKNLAKGRATGIMFQAASSDALTEALERALRLYEDPVTLGAARRAGMRERFSWEQASDAYEMLYREAIAEE